MNEIDNSTSDSTEMDTGVTPDLSEVETSEGDGNARKERVALAADEPGEDSIAQWHWHLLPFESLPKVTDDGLVDDGLDET